MKYSFNDFIIGLLIYLMMLPASLKIFIGTQYGVVVNVLTVFFLILMICIDGLRTKGFKYRKHFNMYLLFLFFIMSFYFYIDIYSVSQSSFRYYLKSLSVVIGVFFIFNMLSINYIKAFLDVTVLFGVFIAILYFTFGINYSDGINYLTVTMPVLLSYILILLRVKVKLKGSYIIYFIFLCGEFYLLMTSQSRAAFLMCVFFTYIILIIKTERVVKPFRYWYLLPIPIAIVFINYVLDKLSNFNYVIYARIMRNFSDNPNLNVTEEDRANIYSSVFYKITNFHDSLLGYGFSAPHDLFNLPYIESFILEYILNFGFLGLIISISFILFLLKVSFSIFNKNQSETDREAKLIYILMFLFFVKGWSVYDSLVILIPLSLIVYLYGIKYVFNNNPNISPSRKIK